MAISLVRKLEQFTPLSEPEKRALQTALARVRDVAPHSDLVSEGDCPTDISLLTEGFACRYKLLGDGRRQITAFPVTQTDIGDALGLSVVHVDRTLQQLRAEGLISLQSSVVVVLNWRRLQEAGEFDPAYLQVQPQSTPVQRTDL